MKTHDEEHEAAGVEALDHVPQPGGRLTGATVATVRDMLLEGGLLFRLDDEQIARHFTDAFFAGNAWKVSLSDLRAVVATLGGCPTDIPADPVEFATWVRTDLLEFQYLPGDKLADLYGWASEDLAAIKINTEYCENQLAEIERRSPKTEGDNSDIGFYRYFIARTTEARDEIFDVLAHRIQREALRAAYGPLVPNMLDFHVPWGFRWMPERYSAAAYSSIAHAFLELPLDEFRGIKEVHRDGRMAEFDLLLAQYVAEHRPVAAIEALLGEHHLLAARRVVLIPALRAYERGELALFASGVAVQIEGIFEDACHLSGVSLDELRVATLVPKLDALLRRGHVRIDYPYYAFKFPILRNRVAHGRLLAADLGRVAQLLMLDLHYACRVVATHPGPQNALVTLLRRCPHPLLTTVEEALNFAVVYADTDGKAPDPFYSLQAEFEAMKAVLDRPRLWAVLHECSTVGREELDCGVRFLANRIRKLRPSLAEAARVVLAALADRGDATFERDEFFSALRRHIQKHSALVHADEELRTMLVDVLEKRERWLRTAERAHERWEARGGHHGNDVDDWLEAERVVYQQA